MIDACASEFAGMQDMMDAAEGLYGKYRWGRYDVIVLPPSFPFGGMENPELTFATPTIIAGDRSLVSLVAHELAHSWRSEEHTSELQSLMRISYAVFCFKKKKSQKHKQTHDTP